MHTTMGSGVVKELILIGTAEMCRKFGFSLIRMRR